MEFSDHDLESMPALIGAVDETTPRGRAWLLKIRRELSRHVERNDTAETRGHLPPAPGPQPSSMPSEASVYDKKTQAFVRWFVNAGLSAGAFTTAAAALVARDPYVTSAVAPAAIAISIFTAKLSECGYSDWRAACAWLSIYDGMHKQRDLMSAHLATARDVIGALDKKLLPQRTEKPEPVPHTADKPFWHQYAKPFTPK